MALLLLSLQVYTQDGLLSGPVPPPNHYPPPTHTPAPNAGPKDDSVHGTS
jgi:hypothetical protein